MAIENWQQAAVAVVVVLVLGLVLWSMRHRIKKLRVRLWGVAVEAVPEPDPGQQDVHTKRSKILKSLVSTVKGAKVGLVDTKVEDSWIVVRKDGDPEPDTGTGPGTGTGTGPGSGGGQPSS
ncbi:hypothetical protein [Streptomyces sp. NBC_01006]|uniref:hypothetical protein n=1 Tax=Streptomyces sp. NBC_01006 TaxID=2903716 RepID=UPI003867C672|nr:hypothetical protein OG509_04560 [Streptomyces sp. NBC_01006]